MKARKILPFIGLIFGAIFWVFDAVLHHYVFKIEDTLFKAIFTDNSEEIWMRLSIVALFLVLGVLGAIYNTRIEKAHQMIEEANRKLKEEIVHSKKLEEQLRKDATTDYLTGVYSRRYFFDTLEQERERSLRSNNPFCIIICDLDNFKQINDTYGHTVGDRVLQTFAAKISGVIRKSDLFARYGGEEFVVLAPEVRVDEAIKIAEKIRSETESLFQFSDLKVTVSIGVSSFVHGDIPDDVIRRADQALYRAKESGKNKVEIMQA